MLKPVSAGDTTSHNPPFRELLTFLLLPLPEGRPRPVSKSGDEEGKETAQHRELSLRQKETSLPTEIGG